MIERGQFDLCVIGDAGGAHVRRRVRAMVDAGLSIELLTPRVSGLENVRETIVANDGAGDILGNWRRAIAAAESPVINIHYASSHGAWAFVMSGDRRPMVLNVMGGDVLFDEQSHPHRIARRMTRQVLRRADVVTAKSTFLADAVCREGVSSDAIQLLFWGIDRGVFSLGKGDRARFQVPDDAFVVFSPRPLHPFYRADVMVKALKDVVEAGVDAHLMLSTYEADPEFADACAAMAGEFDVASRLHMLPPLDAEGMAAAYRTADVAVGIPPSDGFPMTMLEAMACGCVNVATPLDRYRSYVRDGESVVFCEPTPDDLSQALLALFRDPSLRRRISEGGSRALAVLPDIAESARKMVATVRALGPVSQSAELNLLDKWIGCIALNVLSRRFNGAPN
ncbi:MAG: glycosyltransferase family 4 protein [Rhodospirillales bacterium]|nr:glycosyltransferase family 4 protein [Rhodospirillales bacterium]MBO6786001.1 glycosyltransferase family 4 protein [Rhodospirillales bacterium]